MRPPAWSFSGLNGFLTCPKQYYHVKVIKDVKETKYEATLWGTLFHETAEIYLTTPTDLPPEFAQYRSYLDQFTGKPGVLRVEQELGIDRNLEPCAFDSPDVWCRGIVDVLNIADGIAMIDDHKTGKRKPDSRQLKLFALLVFVNYPEVHTCHTTFQWVKTGEQDRAIFRRDQMMDMWNDFLPDLKKYAHAFKTETFIERPSGLCKNHCPVKQCQFCGVGERKRPGY